MNEVFADLSVLLDERPDQPVELDQISFVRADNGESVVLRNDLSCQPAGIKSYSAHIGVCKHGSPDFTLIALDKPGLGKAVYTRSLTCSEAIRFDRDNTRVGDIQSLCVISKNANVFTPTASDDIVTIAKEVEAVTGIAVNRQIISCTGVIGVRLPMDKVKAGIQAAAGKLEAGQLEASANAILTTDKQAKMVSVEFDGIRIAGFCKGAGMIEPNMATMLAYFFTNADLTGAQLEAMLKRACDRTFNAISVDSDTSTSDTVAVMSTLERKMSEQDMVNFERALTAMFFKSSRDILGQGEGARTLIEAQVSLPTSQEDARAYAKKIINSPLIKTAVHGSDPNWGRVVMAVGKPLDRNTLPEIDPTQLRIGIMGETVFDRGTAVPLQLTELSKKMKAAKTVRIDVVVGAPVYTAKTWGCDLSEEYIRINADYTT